MITLLFAIIALLLATIIFMRLPKFGSLPAGPRLERIKKSPHFKNGSFQNQSHTPDLTEGSTLFSVLIEFLFSKKERVKPAVDIPSVKTDLEKLDPADDVLVWFGHSSYFMQVDGKKILVDPVFSGAASPISFTTRSFKNTDRYRADEIPEVDYLFISHDHWDHTDYETLQKVKFKKVITGLGTGAHFERWGIDSDRIIESDWHEEIKLEDGFVVHTVPARHFSGRGLSRNKALWTSFVLQTPKRRFFLGGDSGYDKHFAEAGKKFGGFDLAILENGQYDKSWKYIHMMPEEVLQAAKDLHAKSLFPVHAGKFALGNHPWDEPLKRISALAEKQPIVLLTPMIGERVNLNNTSQGFIRWWENVQ